MKLQASAALLAGALFAAPLVAATGSPVLKERSTSTLTPITITGNAFYNGTDRFYIRGVDYQPGNGDGEIMDPIANATACIRDIAYFQELGINTIRVYDVDNTASHDECMAALEAAGIYLVLDTDTSAYSLNRDDPFESYNSVYLQSVFATVTAFSNYTNVLGFLAGNEIINTANNTDCAPYIKAVIRDIKEYIIAQGLRSIPVGYSAADVSENVYLLAEYLNCGAASLDRTDFYAINDYSWCDPSSFTSSGWDTLVENYTGYGIPLFFSEYGCITNTRTFEEVNALYATEMTGVFSGGLVYEYSEEGNDYGLVTISDGTVTTGTGFDYLKTAYANVTNPTGLGGATTTSAVSTCPTESADWDVANDEIPDTPAKAIEYMEDGAGTGPGLDGDGSQEAGDADTESTGSATAEVYSITATGTSGSDSADSTSTSSSSSPGNRLSPSFDVGAFGVIMVTMLGMLGGIMAL